MKKAKGFFAEFKEFISRGNVIDLAVGIIVGSAFTAIVNSLVSDIIMPFFGWITSGADLTQYKYVFSPIGSAKESAIKYGSFIQNIINFILIAFVVFIMVKAINSFRRKKEDEASPPPDPQLELLAEIRDLLKEKETNL